MINKMGSNGLIARGCRTVKSDPSDAHYCENEGCCKLNVFNWLKEIPITPTYPDVVEIRFKNTRKGFYLNVNGLSLKPGDIVAVEASPGHDIGIISLIGELVREQSKKYNTTIENPDLKKVYRKAKSVDIEKWREAIELEHTTMIKARKLAEDLRLNMKIGDVEYQGDKTKAIFYYIADDRVDFRELIKILAENFKVRIEMRQIGARQEAGRIGGIGSCGRELCCSTWISNFVSVTTVSARFQEISLNPQKLAGQCAKLKCCLNYELDSYLDARKDFPDTSQPLNTFDGLAFHQKTDVFRQMMWYSYEHDTLNFIPIPIVKVKEFYSANSKGEKIKLMVEEKSNTTEKSMDYNNVVGEDSLTRFDNKKQLQQRENRNKNRNRNRDNRDIRNNNMNNNNNNSNNNSDIIKKEPRIIKIIKDNKENKSES